MLLRNGEKVHVMHRTFFEKGGGRTLVGVVEACDAGVARIRGNIFAMDQTKMVPVRQAVPATRFISLVNGEHIVTPLPDTAILEKMEYQQSDTGLLVRDGADCQVLLSALTLS
jgi:hypothetical protein